jgi:hypothetical protein
MNTDFTVIPERTTLYLQVLDAVVNKSYVDYLKQLYSEWLFTRNNVLTPSGSINKPSAKLLTMDQDHGNGSLQKWQPKALKCAAIHLMHLMQVQEDHILWDGKKDGNAGNEHASLSSECENENGNCDKTKADRQQECWPRYKWWKLTLQEGN